MDRLYIAEDDIIEEVGKMNYSKIIQNFKILKNKIESENKRLYDNLKNKTPIIYNFTLQQLNNQIDNNGILEKHFKTRKEVYKEVGGKIVDFKKVFPSV